MGRLLKQILLGCVLLFALSEQVIADALSDAQSAFEAGDFAKAATLYLPLAKQGNALAQFNLGLVYTQGLIFVPDYREAMQWYLLAANQGYAPAQIKLGVLYAQGQAVKQDFKKALHWFQLAADQKDALAQLNLGDMYSQGQGVPQNYDMATQWYRLAADQGNALAQYKLGLSYSEGQGVAPNIETAYTWFNLAAGNAADAATQKKYGAQRDLAAKQISDQKIAKAQQEEKAEALAKLEQATRAETARIMATQADQLDASRDAAEMTALAHANAARRAGSEQPVKASEVARNRSRNLKIKRRAIASKAKYKNYTKTARKNPQLSTSSAKAITDPAPHVTPQAKAEQAIAASSPSAVHTLDPAKPAGSAADNKAANIPAPGAKPAPVIEIWRHISGQEPVHIEDVSFAFDSYKVNLSSVEQLNGVIKYMAEFPDAKLELIGHTDKAAPAKPPTWLSKKRAESIKVYLMNKGIARNRITAEGQIPANPVVDNSAAEGHAKDKVEIPAAGAQESRVHPEQPSSAVP